MATAVRSQQPARDDPSSPPQRMNRRGRSIIFAEEDLAAGAQPHDARKTESNCTSPASESSTSPTQLNYPSSPVPLHHRLSNLSLSESPRSDPTILTSSASPSPAAPSPTQEPSPSFFSTLASAYRSSPTTVTSTPAKRSSRHSSFRFQPDDEDPGTPGTPSSIERTDDEEAATFLLARLDAQKKQAAQPQSIYQQLTTNIFSSFQTVRDSLVGNDAQQQHDVIDWDFWGKLMQDYETIARRNPKVLTRKLHQGVPQAIRGMLWQLMCKGKDPALELTFSNLLVRTSMHEKLIQRDLARTFPKNEYFMDGSPGQEALFNVTKAYSLYDPEVGYCQGISFIVGPLLLNMPEEEAFCCCVRLMKDYGLRELFTPSMVGLQTWLFQFDKIMEEILPPVAKHLEAQGVLSTMYASQWFMTCFAYRFPLDIVFRIFDIVFAEGIEAMFRFGYALLKRNADTILTLDFEELLTFLKINLFDPYIGNVNQLIHDASAIRLPRNKLDKLAAEHRELLKKSGPDHLAHEQLRAENRRVHEHLRRMETAYEQLNREHIALANELVSLKMSRERAFEQVEELETTVVGLTAAVGAERAKAEGELREEMEALARKNVELISKNAGLQEVVEGLEEQLAETRVKYADCENERMELQKKWDGLRRAIG